jgi:hypothetical protein
MIVPATTRAAPKLAPIAIVGLALIMHERTARCLRERGSYDQSSHPTFNLSLDSPYSQHSHIRLYLQSIRQDSKLCSSDSVCLLSCDGPFGIVDVERPCRPSASFEKASLTTSQALLPDSSTPAPAAMSGAPSTSTGRRVKRDLLPPADRGCLRVYRLRIVLSGYSDSGIAQVQFISTSNA